MPYFENVCSAEFLNHKVMIPCLPVEYLDIEYGKESWLQPKRDLNSLVFNKDDVRNDLPDTRNRNRNQYTWPNLQYYGRYHDEDYIKSTRFFLSNGRIDYAITIPFIYNGLSEKISNITLNRKIAKQPFKF